MRKIIGIAMTEQTNTATRHCTFYDRFVIDYVANLTALVFTFVPETRWQFW
jgi:hypothetical protein